MEEKKYCKNCGKEIIKFKIYCSRKCYFEYRHKNQHSYDNLYQSGLITAVENAMDGAERLQLYDYLSDCLIIEKEYRTTAAAIISKLVDDLPKNAEATKTIVDTFDKEKFAEVMRFAQAINGGKPI